jgi:hypothetical protein
MWTHKTYKVYIKIYKNFWVCNCDCDCVQKIRGVNKYTKRTPKGWFPQQLIQKFQKKQKTRTDNTEDNISHKENGLL